nr:hypothetical protein [Tanacetum cinerariifolium]
SASQKGPQLQEEEVWPQQPVKAKNFVFEQRRS